MRILRWLYEKTHKRPAPYYYRYSLLSILLKPIRKWLTNAVAPHSPFNCIRILIYRICGFRIGKGTFIGMRCYLDDMCYQLLTIGEGCTISYGVYFACHGRNQKHEPIRIEDGAYIGTRATVISKNKDAARSGVTVGKNAIVGAATLVNCDVPEGATAVGVPCYIILDASDKASEEKETSHA